MTSSSSDRSTPLNSTTARSGSPPYNNSVIIVEQQCDNSVTIV
jgi:hypothetical protein